MTADEVTRKQSNSLARHDIEAFKDCYSVNAVVIDPQYAEPLRGREAIGKDIADFLVALPDLELKVTRTIVHGTLYAAEVVMSGTQKGPLVTPTGEVAATNKRIRIPACLVVALDKDGLIAEERRYFDLANALSQAGSAT